MKAIAPLLGAGSTFALIVILGLVAGIWLDNRLSSHYWVLALFFAALAVGTFAAWRLVSRALLP